MLVQYLETMKQGFKINPTFYHFYRRNWIFQEIRKYKVERFICAGLNETAEKMKAGLAKSASRTGSVVTPNMQLRSCLNRCY